MVKKANYKTIKPCTWSHQTCQKIFEILSLKFKVLKNIRFWKNKSSLKVNTHYPWLKKFNFKRVLEYNSSQC